MILWIRSIATLSWKLLSPGKEAEGTMRAMNRINAAVHTWEQTRSLCHQKQLL